MSTAALALLMSLSVASQQEVFQQEPRVTTYGPNLLLINPADLFGGALSIEYERALTPWFGLTGGFSVWTFRSLFAGQDQPGYFSVSPEFGARFHFIREAPGGLWIGPYLSGGYVFARDRGSLTRAWAWGVGAAAGYNFIIGHHFTVQLGVGGGFTDYGDRLVWTPRFRLGIGWAF
jgi:murein DD-endopeptidase MepM/ murein hydrolase activator NlpD